MYGMVNKGLRAFIVGAAGEATWQQIRDRAGVDVDRFVSMQGYPDDVTYALAGAAAEQLEQPLPAVLESNAHDAITWFGPADDVDAFSWLGPDRDVVLTLVPRS